MRAKRPPEGHSPSQDEKFAASLGSLALLGELAGTSSIDYFTARRARQAPDLRQLFVGEQFFPDGFQIRVEDMVLHSFVQ